MNWKQTGVVLIASFCVRSSRADELLYSYEAHVPPYDPSAGWIGGAPCEFPCTESVERGRFVLRWAGTGHFTVYGYRISSPPQPHPPSLWVEWHFKSNHPLGSIYYSCDAAFLVDYANVHQKVYMYGDATISGSGDIVVRGLDIDEFHTYRLESSDGVHFRISVDGLEFMDGGDLGDNGYSSIRLEGGGGCFGEDISPTWSTCGTSCAMARWRTTRKSSRAIRRRVLWMHVGTHLLVGSGSATTRPTTFISTRSLCRPLGGRFPS